MDEAAPRKSRRARTPTSRDPIDIAMEAEVGGPPLDGAAHTLLLSQNRLIGLDMQHRRWQIAGERTGVVLKLLTAAAGLTAAAALGLVVWQASKASGLVIEPFSVPPDLAARGVTGQAIAAQLLDRLSDMQAQTLAAKPGLTARNDGGAELKIEIPQTGVSLGEVSRFLEQRLGHEIHVTGEVFRTPAGLRLAARAGENAIQPQIGSDADLDALLQSTAEALYGRAEPYRYWTYLRDHGRLQEGLVQLAKAADTDGDDRAWARSDLARARLGQGDLAGALALSEESVRLQPDNPYLMGRHKGFSLSVGRDEAGCTAARRGLELIRRNPEAMTERSRIQYEAQLRTDIAECQGDFIAGAALEQKEADLPEYFGMSGQAATWVYLDLAMAHDGAGVDRALSRARARADRISDYDIHLQLQRAQVAMGRWPQAVQTTAALQAIAEQPAEVGSTYAFFDGYRSAQLRLYPAAMAAYATAMNGDVARGAQMVADTPLDCYLCLRMRGQIAALGHDRRSAERWFAAAVREGPSMPFADNDWGRMLLDAGDPAAAIGKFQEAHKLGPRFADPLVGWGEALLAQGSPRPAAARFRQAEPFAPNWGRLHLKWGQALAAMGDVPGAKAQFAAADRLELALNERAELAAALKAVR
jgi:tetratricopeptide (TPR) repeat protein